MADRAPAREGEGGPAAEPGYRGNGEASRQGGEGGTGAGAGTGRWRGRAAGGGGGRGQKVECSERVGRTERVG